MLPDEFNLQVFGGNLVRETPQLAKTTVRSTQRVRMTNVVQDNRSPVTLTEWRGADADS